MSLQTQTIREKRQQVQGCWNYSSSVFISMGTKIFISYSFYQPKHYDYLITTLALQLFNSLRMRSQTLWLVRSHFSMMWTPGSGSIPGFRKQIAAVFRAGNAQDNNSWLIEICYLASYYLFKKLFIVFGTRTNDKPVFTVCANPTIWTSTHLQYQLLLLHHIQPTCAVNQLYR